MLCAALCAQISLSAVVAVLRAALCSLSSVVAALCAAVCRLFKGGKCNRDIVLFCAKPKKKLQGADAETEGG